MQKNFLPRSWEKIIYNNELASYIKSAINVDPGNITLTDHRIVFCGKMGGMLKYAALGPFSLLNSPALPKIHFQIVLEDIKSIEILKHGFTEVFLICTNNGQSFKFGVRNTTAWMLKLREAGLSI